MFFDYLIDSAALVLGGSMAVSSSKLDQHQPQGWS